jgi:glycerol uptake facilitator protein
MVVPDQVLLRCREGVSASPRGCAGIGPQTGGSVNPARTFGPFLTLTVFGGDVPWSQFGVYVAGPLVGGMAAVLLYDFVAQTRPAGEEPPAEQAYRPETPGGER